MRKASAEKAAVAEGTEAAGGTENGNGRDALIAQITAENAEFTAWHDKVKAYARTRGYLSITDLPKALEEMEFDPAHYNVRGLTAKLDSLKKRHVEDKARIRDAAIQLKRDRIIDTDNLNAALKAAGLKEYEPEYPVTGYVELNWSEPVAGRDRVAVQEELRRTIKETVRGYIKARAPEAVTVVVKSGSVSVGRAA